LRHPYAAFALRAGVPVFALSRFMGTSIAMIDVPYGHLAVDSHEHAVSLLDALALERAVDAGWSSARKAAKPHRDTVSRPPRSHSRRAVDARCPRSLERRVAGPEVLAVDDDDVPFHDVLRPGTGSRQGRAQVAQDLLGLCGDVADADDVPLGIDRVLAADLEGSSRCVWGTF
jgi:hypothetical protein